MDITHPDTLASYDRLFTFAPLHRTASTYYIYTLKMSLSGAAIVGNKWLSEPMLPTATCILSACIVTDFTHSGGPRDMHVVTSSCRHDKEQYPSTPLLQHHRHPYTQNTQHTGSPHTLSQGRYTIDCWQEPACRSGLRCKRCMPTAIIPCAGLCLCVRSSSACMHRFYTVHAPISDCWHIR